VISDRHNRVAAWLLVGLAPAFVAAVHAHTAIESTVPAQAAALASSPPEIAIRFKHQAQLTSVVLQAAGQSARKLEFEPHVSALEFRLLRPALEPGRNEIVWKGLSMDGHVIGGTLVFVVESPAASSD
jgi:methionine-rich copper-binding protein CopC